MGPYNAVAGGPFQTGGPEPGGATVDRDVLEFDVVIVGAGPAGLAAAIRLRQLSPELSVCVLEKGAEVGAHILSGAVLETRALDELLPGWRETGAPVRTAVTRDRFLLLTGRRALRLPTPPGMGNRGNYLVSLGLLCRWLAQWAEALGVEIFPGFAAAEPLFDEEGAVAGVVTGDMGRQRDGAPGPAFQPGVEVRARQTLVAEGARGSLTRVLEARFALREGCDPQTYGLGLKELWEIAPERHREGTVVHTVGWPLDRRTYGGGFLYHMDGNRVAVGLVVGLDYRNPHLDPFREFQRLKTHPALRHTFAGGRRIGFGARALCEGGYQSIPRLTFPGGALIGDSAGFMVVPKAKGIHTAMQSGMTAAESAYAALGQGPGAELATYSERLRTDWVGEELYRARNVRPAFRWGLWPGLAHAAVDTLLLRGRAPWTLHHHADHARLKPAARTAPMDYPKPDGVLTFDRASSLALANVHHAEGQPGHLLLTDPTLPVRVNLPRFDAPEQRYCPAGVYEVVDGAGGPQLQINAGDCIHCKTCDIKDPNQNIVWTVPEGGGGPNYAEM